MISTTRIFFERTTKQQQTVANLGNVYRNSKWSDLKIQNIKTNFLNQFFTVCFIFLFLLLFYFLIFRLPITHLSLPLIVPSKLWYLFQDLVSYFSLIILSILYSIFYKINSLTLKYFWNNKNSNQSRPRFVSKNKNAYHVNGFTKAGGVDNKNVLLLASSLYKTVNLISLLEVSPLNINSGNYPLLNNINSVQGYKTQVKNILFLNSSNNYNLNFTKINHSIINQESLFLLKNTNIKLNTGQITPQTLKAFSFFNQKLLSLGISYNLNLGKQNRWLLKSSILSNKIVDGTTKITHLKRLFGPATLSQNALNFNIWLSNKFSKEYNFSKLNNTLTPYKSDYGLYSNLYLNSPKVGLNNFENSVFWAVKRFKFLQSMPRNNQIINFNEFKPLHKVGGEITPISFIVNFILHDYFLSQKTVNLYVFKNFALVNSNTSENFNFYEHGGYDMLNLSDISFIKFFTQADSSYKNLNTYYSNI
jgi:hypothetical protein